jgi:hypothetical protein
MYNIMSSSCFAVKAVKLFLSQESLNILLLSLHNDLQISVLGQFLS